MNTFFYLIIFIIGTLFGSFFTLAVYRLPKKQDITHTHSYCPNCNNKLGFFELIPIVSYIALRGKCVHCGLKIRIRYLVLEVASGLVFLLSALSLKLDVFNLTLDSVVKFAFLALYISTLFIIAGIDKEHKNIQKNVLSFGIVLGICYMIYVCITQGKVLYTYIIYLLLIAIMLFIDNVFLKKKLYENYTLSILLLSLYMIIFTGSENFYYTVAMALILIGLEKLLERIKNSKESTINIPIGFYLSIANIFLLIVCNFLR